MTKYAENEQSEINYHVDEIEPEIKGAALNLIRSFDPLPAPLPPPTKDDIMDQLNLSYAIIDTDEQQTDGRTELGDELELGLELTDDEDDLNFDEIIHRNSREKFKV